MSEKAIDIDTLAEKLGVHRSTVYRWANSWGLMDLFDKDQGGFDVEEVRQWSKLMKRERRRVMRPPLDFDEDDIPEEVTGGPGTNVDYQQMYRRGKAALVHLQVRKMQESLIDREEVEKMLTTRVAEISTMLESLTHQLPPILAPLTRESEIQSALRKAFHQLRDHFARENNQ